MPYLVPDRALARSRPALRGRSAGTLAVTRVTDRIAYISGAGGNVVVLSGPESVLLVDSGGMGHTPALLEAIAGLPGGRRVETVFNTHWHWAHTGGNALMRKAGARIIAHENTRLWFGEPIWSQWQHRHYPPRPRTAWPTETFYTSGKVTFAGEPVEYGYLGEAHTDGDLYVYFRGQNVLVPGCVLAVGRYPIIDYSTNGWLGGMAAATARLAAMIDERTRIVPGVGPLQTRADVLAEHAMLADMQTAIWHLMLKGYGIADILAAHPTARYDAKWGDPNLFVNAAFHSLNAHCREIRGAI